MHSRRSLSLIALVLLACTLPNVAAHAASLESLAWMAGSWSGSQGDMEVEEHWLPPRGGLMLCMHRDVKSGRAVSFEFLRVVQRGDSLVYIALPRGRNETAFPMKEMTAKRVVFENPEHDFPQRIFYWQEKPNELHARVEGTIHGKMESEEWVWRRGKMVP